MQIKKIKKLRLNSYVFDITWDKEKSGAEFRFYDTEKNKRPTLRLPCPTKWGENHTFMVLCHELMEMSLVELNVRYLRADVQDDYLFSFNHKQLDSAANMMSGALSQFIK